MQKSRLKKTRMRSQVSNIKKVWVNMLSILYDTYISVLRRKHDLKTFIELSTSFSILQPPSTSQQHQAVLFLSSFSFRRSFEAHIDFVWSREEYKFLHTTSCALREEKKKIEILV